MMERDIYVEICANTIISSANGCNRDPGFIQGMIDYMRARVQAVDSEDEKRVISNRAFFLELKRDMAVRREMIGTFREFLAKELARDAGSYLPLSTLKEAFSANVGRDVPESLVEGMSRDCGLFSELAFDLDTRRTVRCIEGLRLRGEAGGRLRDALERLLKEVCMADAGSSEPAFAVVERVNDAFDGGIPFNLLVSAMKGMGFSNSGRGYRGNFKGVRLAVHDRRVEDAVVAYVSGHLVADEDASTPVQRLFAHYSKVSNSDMDKAAFVSALVGMGHSVDAGRVSGLDLASSAERSVSDIAKEFLELHCCMEDATACEATSDLYERFKAFVAGKGQATITKRAFSNALRDLGLDNNGGAPLYVHRKRGTARGFRGVRLRDPDLGQGDI